jgi:hypothetical protein
MLLKLMQLLVGLAPMGTSASGSLLPLMGASWWNSLKVKSDMRRLVG